MSLPKVHIIHVGNMANKGTQALLVSDVSLIRRIIGKNVSISVSTTDIAGVERLNLGLKAILPPLVDIPYERADLYARRLGLERENVRYKASAAASLGLMFIQIALTVASAVLTKLGVKAFYRSGVLRHIKDSNVVVSYSDENFKESASLLPLNVYWIATWWSMLLSRTWEVLVARFLKKPVVMFPNSVGPFRTAIGRYISKLALNNFDCILLREPVSYSIVESLGVKSPRIATSDTALLLESSKESPENLKVVRRNPTLAVCPGIYSHSVSSATVKKYIEAHAEALDRTITELGATVYFLPHYTSGFRHDDLEISHLIFAKMEKTDNAQIVEIENAIDFKEFLNQVDLVVSSKMHPAVLAISGFTPTLCIAYDHKQTGFFKNLGLSECVIPLHELSSKELSSKIAHVWKERTKIGDVLRKRIPELKDHTTACISKTLKNILERTRSGTFATSEAAVD